jgi:hypothetical protein
MGRRKQARNEKQNLRNTTASEEIKTAVISIMYPSSDIIIPQFRPEVSEAVEPEKEA